MVSGANIVGRVPDTGGGAFGAARLAHIVASIQARLVPGQGNRAGPPERCELGASSQGADE